jgi:hypothetical protein
MTGMQASAHSRRPGNAWGLGFCSPTLGRESRRCAPPPLRSGPPGDSFLAAGSRQTMEAK